MLTHLIGLVYLDLSIWTCLLGPVYFDRLFGPIYLTRLFGPIYLDLDIFGLLYGVYYV